MLALQGLRNMQQPNQNDHLPQPSFVAPSELQPESINNGQVEQASQNHHHPKTSQSVSQKEDDQSKPLDGMLRDAAATDLRNEESNQYNNQNRQSEGAQEKSKQQPSSKQMKKKISAGYSTPSQSGRSKRLVKAFEKSEKQLLRQMDSQNLNASGVPNSRGTLHRDQSRAQAMHPGQLHHPHGFAAAATAAHHMHNPY